MSIEPQIKSRNALAGILGASASCFVLLLLLVYMALAPGSPGDDGSNRGAAIAIGFIPPIWIVLFIYFLVVSFKSKNKFKFAFVVQTFWVTILACLLAYVALAHEGWASALPVFGITFLIFSVVIEAGSWCCTLAK